MQYINFYNYFKFHLCFFQYQIEYLIHSNHFFSGIDNLLKLYNDCTLIFVQCGINKSISIMGEFYRIVIILKIIPQECDHHKVLKNGIRQHNLGTL
jgi:hypothetical protein